MMQFRASDIGKAREEKKFLMVLSSLAAREIGIFRMEFKAEVAMIAGGGGL